MTAVSQSAGWSGLTQATAAPLVAVAVLTWAFLGPSWCGLTPAAATPARPIREVETAPFPMVAQAQTTQESEPARPTEAVPQADPDRQRAEAARQAERDAAARAEQQIRRIEEAIFRQAEEEAAARKAASRRGETVGQPDAARARPQDMETTRSPAAAAPAVAPGSPALSITPSPAARPAEPVMPATSPSALTAQDVTRIQSQAEQRLRSRGLLRESSADRWGVTLEVSSLGHVTLSGLLRDMCSSRRPLGLVREVPGVQGVTGDVKVAETSAPGEPGGVREQIQQKLRSRGLLRASSADRWGVTVEVNGQGDIKLAGALRDAGLRQEAIRLAQEAARATSRDGRDQRGGQVVRGQALGRRGVGRIGVTLGVLIASIRGVAGCTVDGPPGQGPQGARPPAAASPPASVEIPRERTRVYVANESSSTVTVIDGLTFEVVGTIDAKNHATHDLALSRDGLRLFATNLASGRLSVIDTAAMEVVGSVYTGSRPTWSP